MLDVDATGPEPAPASFTETLPFFRGTVCAATNIQPGDKIPVHIEMCVDPCINANGHKFKSQYKCNGTVCEAVLVTYLPDAVGTNCPANAFGKFPEANCQTVTIDASAGPLSTQSSGAINPDAPLAHVLTGQNWTRSAVLRDPLFYAIISGILASSRQR